MNPILIKIFATALAMSQVTAGGDSVKTAFDPVKDQDEVVQLLKNGCTQMRKSFDIEDINLDELIDTAMKDPQALTGEIKAFKGLNFSDLLAAYRQFCKNERVANSSVDIGELITFYNKAMEDLPDHNRLKNYRLPGASVVLDGKGERFAEIFEPNHRRVWIPLSEIPEVVQKAFIAAEDKRFYQHAGVDERAVIRAFVTSMGRSGRPQGGSTITQQVVKTLLVGDDVSYERKIREIVIASRVEKLLSKPEILELYMNSIYLGRGSWGVEMAARTYFGKPAKELTLEEGALLAGVIKGPSFYSPDRQPGRAQERLSYVLTRLQADNMISPSDVKLRPGQLPALIPERQRRDAGYHYVDHLTREAKKVTGITSLTSTSYVVRSTINPAMQRAAEIALQDGLAAYEKSTGRARFSGPEMNLGDLIRRIEARQKSEKTRSVVVKPTWRLALERARLPLYDVHWDAGIVVEKGRDPKVGEVLRIGLRDGRIVPMTNISAAVRRMLNLHDVVYVRVVEDNRKRNIRAELRVRPQVQGAVFVLENKTGRILAMAGGFSYPLSQLNRVAQAARQPGSALKPLTYLAVLGRGLQPNTLVYDAPITLPPIGGTRHARPEDYWTPKNYDGGAGGTMTLRRALENSKNLVTARMLDGGITDDPPESLARLCELAQEAHIYKDCIRYYPFVLGAQPVRMIDLATFYASVANEGMRPEPYAVESVEHDGKVLYRRPNTSLVAIGSADNVAFFQLKSILQGVLARGTARRIGNLAQFVAGKTGTSDEENDAWFVGFTNDVTVAVWAGYDNRGKRRTLGGAGTGSGVAIPIFEPVIKASWEHVAPRAPLAGPSPEVKRQIVSVPIDIHSGERYERRDRTTYGDDRYTGGQPVERPSSAFMEHFRLDESGRIKETQSKLVSRGDPYGVARDPDPWGGSFFDFGRFFGFGAQQPPQRYGTPGYGGQRYGNPSYGNPSYGNQRYGNPSYGNPGYGNPSYGNQRYSNPSYGSPNPGGQPRRYRQPDSPFPFFGNR